MDRGRLRLSDPVLRWILSMPRNQGVYHKRSLRSPSLADSYLPTVTTISESGNGLSMFSRSLAAWATKRADQIRCKWLAGRMQKMGKSLQLPIQVVSDRIPPISAGI